MNKLISGMMLVMCIWVFGGCEQSFLSSDWTDSSLTEYFSGKTLAHSADTPGGIMDDRTFYGSNGRLVVSLYQNDALLASPDTGRWSIKNRNIIWELEKSSGEYRIVSIEGAKVVLKSMGAHVEGEYIGPAEEELEYHVVSENGPSEGDKPKGLPEPSHTSKIDWDKMREQALGRRK